MAKYLSPIKSTITGSTLYPPLYKFHDKCGGLYSLYNDEFQIMSVMSPQLIDISRSTLDLTSNDIVICNYWKAGTHFMKKILLEILRNHDPKNHKYSSNIDLGLNIPCIEGVSGVIGLNKWNQWLQSTNDGFPRLLHTHFPPNIFPVHSLHPNTKILFITRNPKDVAVSMHFMLNFIPDCQYKSNQENINEETFELFLNGNMYCGDYWDYNRKWFQFKNYKNIINHHNVLFLYFEDLIDFPLQNIQKIAKFIDCDQELNDEKYENIVHKTMFKNVKKEYVENPGNFTFNDKIGLSPNIFFRNGQNEDWKNYFTKQMSDRFDEKTKEKFEEIPPIKYYQNL